jgi:hypothetical protein
MLALRHLLLPLLWAAALSVCSWTKPPSEEDESIFSRRQWKEIPAELPPYPSEENLLPFEVMGASKNRFFIDSNSIAPGKDGVIRYTVVITSPSGARTVNFEGIRCTSRQFKRYAFGRSDKSWSKSRDETWHPIEYDQANPYHSILYSDFFCPTLIPVRSREEAVQALRRGIHPRAFKVPQ